MRAETKTAPRVVRLEITPRMHEIAKRVALTLTAVDEPQPKRGQMLDDFYHRHAMQDLIYLLNKLELRADY